MPRSGPCAPANPAAKRVAAAKPPKPVKTAEDRRRETDTIRAKLAEFGFAAQDLQEVERLMLDFEDQGWGSTREHRLPHLGVSLLVQLSTQPRIASFVRLRPLRGRSSAAAPFTPGSRTTSTPAPPAS